MSLSLQMVGMRRNGYHDDGLNNTNTENCKKNLIVRLGWWSILILFAIAITLGVLFSVDKKMIDGTIYEHQIVQQHNSNTVIYDGNIHIIYEFKSHDNTRWKTVYTDTNRSEVINVLNTNYTIGNDYEVKKIYQNTFFSVLLVLIIVSGLVLWIQMIKYHA